MTLFFFIRENSISLYERSGCMNKQQLELTIKYLREVSEELLSTVSEKESVDKDLMILSANEKLLNVIDTLQNRNNEMEEES